MWIATVTHKKTNKTNIYKGILTHCAETISYYKKPDDLLLHKETIHHITTRTVATLDLSSDEYFVSIQY